MHSPLMMAWGFRGPRMSGTCGMHCKGDLRSKPNREGWPQQSCSMEEEDKEEDQSRGSSVASGVAPLQAPEPVEGGPV